MEIAKFWGQNPKTPEPIDKKFGVDDYVGDDSQHAKVQNERPIKDVAAHACNITLAWFLVFLSYLSYPFLETLNFARVPRLNRNTEFYAVCFI